MLLKGKKALITGGTKGIGLAIAKILTQNGATVAVNYFKSRQAADEIESELKKLNPASQPLLIRANVGNPEQIKQKIADEIRSKWGTLDILVSNVAVGALRKAVDITEEDWQKTLDLSSRAFLLLVKNLHDMMPEGSKILTITSHGSKRYIPEYAAVGSAKAALETLVRYFAFELAYKKIYVNAICSGVVDTESLKAFPSRELMLKYSLERTPLNRLGTPEDIAKVALFLCSGLSDWITGQIIVADGGFSLI
ncbi:MAG: SDR family oxidoreductase [Planctomycetes bacterium]|nr:SDR family oxidoreductase [Planctomycetota bacterium]